MKHFLFLTLLLAGCPGKDDEEEEEDTEDTGSSDTDDSGTDDSQDSGTGNGPPNYETFVTEHATAYCTSVETCGFLDELGFPDRQGCIDRLTSGMNSVECNDYDRGAAGECISADEELAESCAASGAPPVCNRVCARPDTAAE